MANITKRFIDSMEPGSKDIVAWDDALPGFGIRVKPSGVKTFLIQYRNAGGQSKRLSIGKSGVLAPDEARRLAKDKLAEVAKGQDPAEARKEQRKAETVSELADQYMERHAKPKKRPASISRDQQFIDRFIKPKLGKLKVEHVTRADIARLHHDLRNTPTQANRILALLSKMFSLAIAWGLRPSEINPCRRIERNPEVKRKRYLSGEELARLGATLAKTETYDSKAGVLAVRLLLFTGCRLSEILTLKWDYLDLERGVMNLPESKTGAKTVPLSESALELLKAAQYVEGTPYVIFGEKPGKPYQSIHHLWKRVCERADLSGVRLHDLRHSFASVAVASGMGLPVIGALLGHTQAATTQRYAHMATDPLKVAADEIARRIDEAMKKKPKVVSIRNR